MKEQIKQAVINATDCVERNLTASAFIFVGLAIITITAFTQSNNITDSTVMIVNTSRNSGGTGVVLKSTALSSTILTNSHVCRVVENGGLVIHRGTPHMVVSYKRSEQHDLCLITVNNNLGINTKVASRPPAPPTEKAQVSGHPHLLPVVVSSGHFSGSEIIPVMTGFEPCTGEEEGQDEMTCIFLGAKPVIKTYESTLVTATIMPGSSGSGVYDSDGNLNGLVFAGSSDFGYAWTVPYFALVNFLQVEADTLADIKPSGTFRISNKKTKSFDVALEEAREVCASDVASQLKDLCRIVKGNLVWTR